MVTVSGELDIASSDELERELALLDGEEIVVIELGQLAFIDSTGLGVLVRAHQRALELGHRLALVRGNGQVNRLLSMTGLDDQLFVGDSADELLAS